MSKACESSPPAKEAAGDVQVQCLLCKSCGLCAEYCPRQLMKPATEIPEAARPGGVMNPAGHVVYVIYDPEGKCTGCGICAQACPEGAVVVYRRKRGPLPEGEGGPPKAGRVRGSSAGEPLPEGEGKGKGKEKGMGKEDSNA